MRPAAQLLGEARHLDDPHPVLVLLAEERDGAGRHRLVQLHHLRPQREVPPDVVVDQALDLAELGRGERSEVSEVEAQSVLRDQRAGLLHVRAQDRLERGVQQMGRCVVLHRQAALLDVDGRFDLVAHLEPAARHFDPMADDHAPVLRVDDTRAAALVAQ